MRPPLITVVTAVRNGDKQLKETIRSIQAQDIEDWEYIIVDDASTDQTVAVVEQEAKSDTRLRLLRRTESGGPYTAANDALAISRGRYIMRTDADDLQPPDRFRKQLNYLAEHKEYRSCISYWQPFDEYGLRPRVITVPSPRVLKWYLTLRSPSVHSSLCIERDALLGVGGYRNLPLSQDYQLWCELTVRGWLGVIPEPLSYVRFHAGRSTNTCGKLQRTLAQKVAREHWRSLTGQPLSVVDSEALWAVGYSLPFDIGRGLMMLENWNHLARRDSLLTTADHQELIALSDLRKWKFLRGNVRSRPVQSVLRALWMGRRIPALIAAAKAAA